MNFETTESFDEFQSHLDLDDTDYCDKLDLELLADGDRDGDGMDFDGTKESTGRWSREEHILFLKGLEMYGKGWKKIAGLIKTRTVVQIRTHAQKYFLKLAKTRQHGETGCNSNNNKNENERKKKMKRNFSERQLAVAPPLQPFLKSKSCNVLSNYDINDGLYNFLSPSLDIEENETTEENDISTKKIKLSSDDDSSSGLVPKNVEKILPTWYRTGDHVDVLLKQAESLNWMEDNKNLIFSDNMNFADPLMNNDFHAFSGEAKTLDESKPLNFHQFGLSNVDISNHQAPEEVCDSELFMMLAAEDEGKVKEPLDVVIKQENNITTLHHNPSEYFF